MAIPDAIILRRRYERLTAEQAHEETMKIKIRKRGPQQWIVKANPANGTFACVTFATAVSIANQVIQAGGARI